MYKTNFNRLEKNEWPGKSFLQVMMHEIGHVIGINHSNYWDAVMYAYYEYKADFQLTEDDINAVQALYGWLISLIELICCFFIRHIVST